MTVAAPRRLLALVAALVASVLMAGTASGHAALVSSPPAEGARVATDQVRTVTLAFDDDLFAAKAQFGLADERGTTVATGRVGADVKTMTAAGRSLVAISCQGRRTAATSDGGTTRGVVRFVATAMTSAAESIFGGPSAPGGDGSTAAAASPPATPRPSGAPVPPSSPDSGGALAPITVAAAFIALVAVLLARRTRAA